MEPRQTSPDSALALWYLHMLSRLHREALHRREDNSLSELVDEILGRETDFMI